LHALPVADKVLRIEQPGRKPAGLLEYGADDALLTPANFAMHVMESRRTRSSIANRMSFTGGAQEDTSAL
jgi:hypothetical protein